MKQSIARSATAFLIVNTILASAFYPSYLVAQPPIPNATPNTPVPNAPAPIKNETEGPILDADQDASKSAIRQAINSYVKTFNRGDANKLAEHWTIKGLFKTPSGATLAGREELANGFSAYFEENPEAKIELPETSITLLSPNVALESGIARVILPNSEPSDTVYEAIHIQTEEGWKIDSVEEEVSLAAPPAQESAHYEQLASLEWMIGDWIDTGEDSLIETNCNWTKNKNYLVRTFKVFIEDRIDFEGTQVIGWDPYNEAIRSWTFDSDGGFGVGRWSGDGSRWTVRNLSVLPDGRRGSSTNIYEVLDENRVRFRSLGRQVDGELLPSIEPIVVTRIQAQ